MKKPVYITLAVITLFTLGYYSSLLMNREEDDTFGRAQVAIGTVVEIQIRGMADDRANTAIDAAFGEIRRLDTLFSPFVESGPVWHINQSPDTLFTVSGEMYALMQICDSLWRSTDGALDVAMSALVRAWGFDGVNYVIPGERDLAEARHRSGWENIELLPNGRVLRRNAVELNFGAIAKGLVVDRAVEILKSHGVTDALVDAGGEIRAIGGPWTVGIQDPREKTMLIAVLELHGKAVATSGDYEQFFEAGGQRYHHIFDPATGRPASGCRSVTIIADSDLIADAMATAVFVLGPERGTALINEIETMEVMIVDSLGEMHSTPGFEHYIKR